MEVFFNVIPLCVQFQCPTCKAGYLVATGHKITSGTPRYAHVCNNSLCGQTGYLDAAYPQLRNVVQPNPIEPAPIEPEPLKAIN